MKVIDMRAITHTKHVQFCAVMWVAIRQTKWFTASCPMGWHCNCHGCLRSALEKHLRIAAKCKRSALPVPPSPPGEAFFMHTRDWDFWATKQQTGHKATRTHMHMHAPAAAWLHSQTTCWDKFQTTPPTQQKLQDDAVVWGRADFETYAPQLSSAQCKAHMCVAEGVWVCVGGVCVCCKSSLSMHIRIGNQQQQRQQRQLKKL